MKFEDALKAMREGKEAIRPQYFLFPIYIRDNRFRFEHSFDGEHYAELTESDILAEDWEIVEG